jgi:hypothetical protein
MRLTRCSGATLVSAMLVSLALTTVPSRSASPSPTPSLVGPTGTPSATWIPSWSPESPSSSDPIVRDEFLEAGPWWTGSDEIGTSGVAKGALRWTIGQERQTVWDSVVLPAALDQVRVDASVLVDEGNGGGGPLCAGADPGVHALWAGINGDGEWLVGRIADTHLQVIDRGEIPTVRRHDVPVGAAYPLLVTLECTSDPTAGDRARVWVSGIEVADVVDVPTGPYLRAGLTASADQPPFAITFEDFEAFAGPAGASPVPAAPEPSA